MVIDGLGLTGCFAPSRSDWDWDWDPDPLRWVGFLREGGLACVQSMLVVWFDQSVT
jgi:hypothetical protein